MNLTTCVCNINCLVLCNFSLRCKKYGMALKINQALNVNVRRTKVKISLQASKKKQLNNIAIGYVRYAFTVIVFSLAECFKTHITLRLTLRK